MLIDFPSERVIEDYVEACISQTSFCPISGQKVSFFHRQPNMGRYGRPDIVKFDVSLEEINVTILELKNVALQADHVFQLSRYMSGARFIADRYHEKLPHIPKINVRGQLAGPLNLEVSQFPFMADVLDLDVQIFGLELSMEEGFVATKISRGWFFQRAPNRVGARLLRQIDESLATARFYSQVFEVHHESGANLSGRGE